jgi:hypothetical protein
MNRESFSDPYQRWKKIQTHCSRLACGCKGKWPMRNSLPLLILCRRVKVGGILRRHRVQSVSIHPFDRIHHSFTWSLISPSSLFFSDVHNFYFIDSFRNIVNNLPRSCWIWVAVKAACLDSWLAKVSSRIWSVWIYSKIGYWQRPSLWSLPYWTISFYASDHCTFICYRAIYVEWIHAVLVVMPSPASKCTCNTYVHGKPVLPSSK